MVDHLRGGIFPPYRGIIRHLNWGINRVHSTINHNIKNSLKLYHWMNLTETWNTCFRGKVKYPGGAIWGNIPPNKGVLRLLLGG